MMKKIIATTLVLMLAILVLGSIACAPAKKPQVENPKPPESNQNAAPLREVPGSISQPESAVSAGNGDVKSLVGGPSSGSTGPTNSATAPAAWPSEVPIMEGLKAATTSTAGIFVAKATGKVKPKDVEKFYSNLEGWAKKKPAMGEVVNPNVIAFTMEKEGKTLNVTITVSSETTIVQLMYTPKH
jgi:hypothetical protein